MVYKLEGEERQNNGRRNKGKKMKNISKKKQS